MNVNNTFLEKKFNVLIFSQDLALCNFISGFSIFHTVCAHDMDELKTVMIDKHYSLIMFDMGSCTSIDEAVDIAYYIRTNDVLAILIIITDRTDPLINDIRLVDLPLDDFVTRPVIYDLLREKLVIWATRYKRRFLSCIELENKMKKYKMGVDVLKDLESRLRSIIEFQENQYNGNGQSSAGSDFT